MFVDADRAKLFGCSEMVCEAEAHSVDIERIAKDWPGAQPTSFQQGKLQTSQADPQCAEAVG